MYVRTHATSQFFGVSRALSIEGVKAPVQGANIIGLFSPVQEALSRCGDAVAQQLDGRPNTLARLAFHLKVKSNVSVNKIYLIYTNG